MTNHSQSCGIHLSVCVCATKLSHLLLGPCNFSAYARTLIYYECKATLKGAICHSRWVGKIVLAWHATCVQFVLNYVITVWCARNKTNFSNLSKYIHILMYIYVCCIFIFNRVVRMLLNQVVRPIIKSILKATVKNCIKIRENLFFYAGKFFCFYKNSQTIRPLINGITHSFYWYWRHCSN